MLTCFPVHEKCNPLWLNITEGEILRTTHDEPRNQPFSIGVNYGEFKVSDSIYQIQISHFCLFEAPDHTPAHEAVNDAGEVGCEYTSRLSTIHPF